MAERYERVYDVVLLDDLHNYFPALLYNHEVFRNVQDVLLYIRERTQRRFNLFDYGRRQYETSMPIPPLRPPVPRRPNPVVEEVHVEFTPNQRVDPSLSTLLPLLRTLNIPVRTRAVPAVVPGVAANLYEDVVVHASQDTINGASTETTLVEDIEDNCAICQDRMRQGEMIRKLSACEHTFHRACIDNWLLTRSVRCPTCRHDIRQPVADGRRSQVQSPMIGPMPAPSPIGGDTNALRNLDEMLPEDLINLLFGRRLV